MGTRKRGAILLFPLLLALSLGGCARREEPHPSAIAPARQGTIAPLPAVSRAAPTATPANVAGIANVGSLPEPTPPPQVYIVQAGDTLSGIARQFGCDVEALVQANNLSDPNSLQIGQALQVPSTQIETGPAAILLPNSEFVYGPAYVDFDTAAFAAEQGGYLALYQETVSGETLSGPEIVDLVAHHYSVGPRLLLAILEMRGGWVTDPDPSGAGLSYPMGYRGSGWDLLSRQLAWAADELNRGYYDWRGRGVEFITWGDGTASSYAPTLNAATAGLQYFFSLDATRAEWAAQVGQGAGSFIATYRQLFGDPASYAVEPLVPSDTVCPELALPWLEGELWFYTGGPHGGWSDGSAWSALDFVPDEGFLGCQAAASWTTAAAPGLVIYSQNGEVLVDLDGDGHEQTGWVLFYLHVATQGRVAEGTRVQTGDPIGHPSCEGGFSESTHLHLARRFNGEWLAADGPLPMVLSGWRFASAGAEYEGSASRDGEARTACECRDAQFNGLLADR